MYDNGTVECVLKHITDLYLDVIMLPENRGSCEKLSAADEGDIVVSDSLICVVCKKVYLIPSYLCTHHQNAHTKKELSKALITLQTLLVQAKSRIDYDDPRQNLLYNCINAKNTKVFVEKSSEDKPREGAKNQDLKEANEKILDDDNDGVNKNK